MCSSDLRRLCRQNEGFSDAFESRSQTIAARDAMKRERDAARHRQWMTQKGRLEVARHGGKRVEFQRGSPFIAVDSGAGRSAITIQYMGNAGTGGFVAAQQTGLCQMVNTTGTGAQLTNNAGGITHQFAVDVAQQFAAQVDQRVRETLQRYP